MKRLPILVLMILATLGADCPFEGYYAGGSIGLLTSSASLRQISPLLIGEFVEDRTLNDQRVTVCNATLWGEGFVGWGCLLCDPFYLGGRLGANVSSGEVVGESAISFPPTEQVSRKTLRSQRARISMNNVEPTVDLKGGWIPCDTTMLFGFIGLSYNHITMTLEQSFDLFETVTRRSVAGDVLGIRFGAGIEQLFCCRYALILSYTYTSYPTRHHERQVPLEPDDTVTLLLRARPIRQVASIGLAYYF
jgi:hypothetical protein